METLWQHKNKTYPSQFPEYMLKSSKKPWTLFIYIRWNFKKLQDQNVTEIRKKKKKTGESVDTNTDIMAFNTYKIPKVIKIGF